MTVRINPADVALPKIIRTKKVPTANAVRSQSRHQRKKMSRQFIQANVGAVVTVILLAVSLTHQARGIGILTEAALWECWALAIGIEIGFLVLKMNIVLSATAKVREKVKFYSNPALFATVLASALMNAFSFSAPMHGVMKVPAIIIGILMSGIIFSLSQSAATLYLDCDR